MPAATAETDMNTAATEALLHYDELGVDIHRAIGRIVNTSPGFGNVSLRVDYVSENDLEEVVRPLLLAREGQTLPVLFHDENGLYRRGGQTRPIDVNRGRFSILDTGVDESGKEPRPWAVVRIPSRCEDVEPEEDETDQPVIVENNFLSTKRFAAFVGSVAAIGTAEVAGIAYAAESDKPLLAIAASAVAAVVAAASADKIFKVNPLRAFSELRKK